MPKRVRVLLVLVTITSGIADDAFPPGARLTLENRVKAMDRKVNNLAGKLRHDGSTTYWQRFSRNGSVRDLDNSVKVDKQTIGDQLLAIEAKLQGVLDHMTSDDDGVRGSSAYWREASNPIIVNKTDAAKPLNANAQAKSCIDDAKTALIAAAQVSSSETPQQMVQSQVAVAESKLQCALAHLTINDVNGGSSGYWNRDFLSGDGFTVLFGACMVVFLVAGSIATISILQSPLQARVEPTFPGAGEGLLG